MFVKEGQASDLKELYKNVIKDVNRIKGFANVCLKKKDELGPKEKCTCHRIIKSLQKNLGNLYKYSYFMEAYGKNIKLEEDELRKKLKNTQTVLSNVLKRMSSLEQQSAILRQKVNMQNQEIKKLRCMMKINATFVSSLYLQTSEFQEDKQNSEYLNQSQKNNSIQEKQLSEYYSQSNQSSGRLPSPINQQCISECSSMKDLLQSFKDFQLLTQKESLSQKKTNTCILESTN